jgi:uncharacterized protein
MATTFSLRDLALAPGAHHQEQLEITLRPYKQGGFDYRTATGDAGAKLDVTAMNQGWALRLRLAARLTGPCSRCLEDAHVDVDVDAREVHDPFQDDEELVSEFVDGETDDVDVTGWAADAIGVQFPTRVLCTEHCKGLCAQCGQNLNEANCDCTVEEGDPRWAALADLRLEAEE